MNIATMNRETLESKPLPEPSILITMADSAEQLAVPKDPTNVIARLSLIFNDAGDGFQQVRPPSLEDARRIIEFVRSYPQAPRLVVQCQVGVGRSQAVQAAFVKIFGHDPRPIFRQGTYNRRLYRLLLEVAGIKLEPEPLVSMNVRVKYGPERLELFLLSMLRQRYENWEVVAVTDGPNPEAACLVQHFGDPRLRLIETEQALGRWGYPYRQLGIDSCRGEIIGLANDDNYYVPGYVEQMVQALDEADLAMCFILHNFTSWGIVDPGGDLGCWLARAALVRQVPWPGDDYDADEKFIAALRQAAGDRTAIVERTLFVHN